jgi:hypothetical protein
MVIAIILLLSDRFMAGTHDREAVADFFAENGGSIDHDNFFMPIEKLVNAPFTVYVVEQREGDFVLVPPLAPHQVINKVENFVLVFLIKREENQ